MFHLPDMSTSSFLRDPALCKGLVNKLESILNGRKMRFMEVCGTHTVAIFQSGLRSLLPESIIHVSGPGCPVCVTHDSEVGLFLQAAEKPNVILATFGDLLRVPGPDGGSLKKARAEGADIRIVYSPLEALNLAADNPDREVVFPGIGFETTAPLTAAAIQLAHERKLKNFSVISLHKFVPPAIKTILEDPECAIDSFLLPGHVATITGLSPFAFIGASFKKPAVVGGFEAVDILLALVNMASAFVNGNPVLANAYPRAVNNEGNPTARKRMNEVFEIADASWRGLGEIAASGLRIQEKYESFDAVRKLDLKKVETAVLPGCRCGSVLMGHISPDQCPLFGKACTPANPVGPCMVSTEGSCSAAYKYGV